MAVVGEASIKIVADVSNLRANIERQLEDLNKKSNTIGKSVSNNLTKGFGEKSESGFKTLGDRDGGAYADAFATKMSERLGQRLPSIANQIGVQLGDGIAISASDRINKMGERVDVSSVGKKIKQQIQDEVKNIDINPAPTPRRSAGRRGGGGKDDGENYGRSFWEAFDRTKRKQAPFEGMIINLVENFMQFAAMQALITGVVAAVMSLVSALGVLAAGAGQAAMAFLSLGNVFGAFLQGMMVLKSVFGGVGKAIGALSAAQNAAKLSALDLAERALAAARAQLSLKQAILQQGRTQEDALKRITDAQRNYEQALKNEQRAQEALQDARKNAAERIEDLTFALEDAALSEERSELNLRKAERALQQARSGGNANAIYEADLAYREAELSLRKLRESNNDLKDEAAETFAEGVDGNQQVKDAQERVEDSSLAIVDALRELRRSQEDYPIAIEDAALRVKEAALALQRALEPPNQNAIDAVNEAMKDLSPSAKAFSRYWVNSVMPVFKDIRKQGQEAFFPGLLNGMKAVMGSKFPTVFRNMFVGTSKVLGDFSENFLKTFALDKNQDMLNNIFSSNTRILETLGGAATKLITPLLQIGQALAPLAERMATRWADAAGRFATFIDTANNTGKLQEFFNNAEKRMLSIKEMFKAFGPGIKAVVEAMMPAVDILINGITKMGEDWSKTFDDQSKITTMETTFKNAALNALDILDAVGGIGGALFDLSGNRGIGEIADAFDRIVPKLEAAADAGLDQISDDLARIVEGLGGLAAALANSQALNVFFWALSGALWAIGGALGFISSFKLGNFPIGAIAIGVITFALGVFKVGSLLIGLLGRIKQSVSDTNFNWKNWKSVIKNEDQPQRRMEEETQGVEEAARRVSNRVSDAGSILGEAFGQGMVNGIASKKDDIQKAAKALADAALEAVRDTWQVKSPSKRMQTLTEGLLEGITNILINGATAVTNAARGVANKIVAEFSGASDEARAAGAGISNSAADGIKQGAGEMRQAAAGAAGAAADGLNQGDAEFQREGAEQAQKYAQGMQSQTGTVQQAGAATAGAGAVAADDTGKKANKAAGENSGSSFADGVKNQTPAVEKAGKATAAKMEEGEAKGGTGAGTAQNIIKSQKAASKGFAAMYVQARAGGAGVFSAFKEGLKGKGKLAALTKAGIAAATTAAVAAPYIGWASDIIGATRSGGAGAGAVQAVNLVSPDLASLAGQTTNVNFAPSNYTDVNSLVNANTSNYVSQDFSTTFGAPGYAVGGFVRGRYRGGDTVPAMLTPGEYVLTRDMVRDVGVQRLDDWRSNVAPAPSDAIERDPQFIAAVERLKLLMGKGMSPGAAAVAASAEPVQKFAKGGRVKGRDRGFDSELAMLRPGEYVLPKDVVQFLGGSKKLDDVVLTKQSKDIINEAYGLKNGMGIGGTITTPSWLTDPYAPLRSDPNVINYELVADWIDREMKRLMEKYRNEGKFEAAYESQFTEALKTGVTEQHAKQTAGQEAVKKALELKRAQTDMQNQFGLANWQMSEYANRIAVEVPVPIGQYGFEYSYLKDRKADASGRLMEVAEGDAELARYLATQIDATAEFESAVMAAYKAARQKAIDDAAAANAGGGGGTSGGPETGGCVPGVDPDCTPPPPGAVKYPPGYQYGGRPTANVNYDKYNRAPKIPLAPPFDNLTSYVGSVRSNHSPLDAIDFPIPGGFPVYAVFGGRIVRKWSAATSASNGVGYGNYIAIEHGKMTDPVTKQTIGPYWADYAHLRDFAKGIKQNAIIKAGTHIGYVGSTGKSSGNHLHLRITPNNRTMTGTAEILKKWGFPIKYKTTQLTQKDIPIVRPGSTAKPLAKGGIVHATPGGVSAIIAEGGRDERVTPLDSKGRSRSELEMLAMMQRLVESRSTGALEIVNHIYPAPGMDERVLAEEVSRRIMYSRSSLS